MENHLLCKSIFKNGSESVSITQLTKKWIEIINLSEKNKSKIVSK